MPIQVTDYISTTDPSDTYATHNSGMGRGGLHEVADITSRNAVTAARRVEGMLAYVQSEGAYYTLQADLTTWVAFSGGGSAAQVLAKEAGEDLAVGDPVYVSVNKFYLADNVVSHAVIGVVTTGALTGFLASAVIAGSATLSGLSDGSPYFLGNKVISTAAPGSGNVVRVGRAISATTLLVNIEEPILLN